MRIIHVRSSGLTFKTKLIIALVLTMTFTLLFLFALAAIGVMLVLVPALLFAGVVYALVPGRRSGRSSRSPSDKIVEGSYRIIDRKDGH